MTITLTKAPTLKVHCRSLILNYSSFAGINSSKAVPS